MLFRSSLKTMVRSPASTASRASAKAYCPGVDTSATVESGSSPRAAAATVAGGGAAPNAVGAGLAASVSAASTSALAASSASWR